MSGSKAFNSDRTQGSSRHRASGSLDNVNKIEGNALFRYDASNYNPNDWDDSVLIKTYEAAVNSFGRQCSVSAPNSATPSKTNQKDIKKAWRVNDKCCAVFSEDGEVYAALIVKIKDAQSCIVRYFGYGNEEEQNFSDLLPYDFEGTPVYYDENDNDPENDIMMIHPSASSGVISSVTSEPIMSGRVTMPNETLVHSLGTPVSTYAMPANPTGPPIDSCNFPQSVPPTPNSVSGAISNGALPLIPPPPPIPAASVTNDQALNAMLMSWYMVGYHSGYYLGLQHGRASNAGDFSARIAPVPSNPDEFPPPPGGLNGHVEPEVPTNNQANAATGPSSGRVNSRSTSTNTAPAHLPPSGGGDNFGASVTQKDISHRSIHFNGM